MISEKNNTLLAISESLSDLGQKLQEEKLNIEKEMVKQRKVIQRLKLRNNQLREKLQRKNSLKRKENERFVCDNKDDSGRESANNSSDTGKSSQCEEDIDELHLQVNWRLAGGNKTGRNMRGRRSSVTGLVTSDSYIIQRHTN